jgi:hypothetical protein
MLETVVETMTQLAEEEAERVLQRALDLTELLE